MANESFDVNWADVELVNQPNGMTCWAASASMVVGWRDRVSIDIDAIVAGTGDWAAYTAGLNPGDVPTLATAWNLVQENPQSYTIDGLRQLLLQGPLWVCALVPGLHAIVITGMYSSGTVDSTFIRINDPWDRDPGTPGNAGAYLSTHDHGSQYVLTLAQFAEEYEAAASVPDLNIQLLRTNGR